MHVFTDMADDVYIGETLEDELEDDEDVEIVEEHADDGEYLPLENRKALCGNTLASKRKTVNLWRRTNGKG